MDGSQIWHEPYTSVYFNRVIDHPGTLVKFPEMKSFIKQFEDAAEIVDSVMDQYEGGNLQKSDHFTYDYIKGQLEKPPMKGKKFMVVKDAAFGIDGHYDMLPKGEFK
ncbi:hypothetical protein, partial [Salmonella sp. s54395]|uniref:hypothetical protein n=1 Tax=Salmonella sp. s54395 TaxID=3159664 RepID=UPI00397EACAD